VPTLQKLLILLAISEAIYPLLPRLLTHLRIGAREEIFLRFDTNTTRIIRHFAKW
jgi:hypothetical protein